MEKVEVTGELQEKGERGYSRWCGEMGVPVEIIGRQTTFLDVSRVDCGKTQTKRENREDGMGKLEKEMVRKSIPEK